MTDLPQASRRVVAAARESGLDIEVRRSPAGTRTAEEAAAYCGCAVGQIVKSLVFRGGETGRPYLLLVSGANRVDEALAAETIGEPLARPDAAFVRSATGFAIGGVAPFGMHAAVKTFIDAVLFEHEILWAAAGTPDTVFPVAPGDLARATGARTITVARLR